MPKPTQASILRLGRREANKHAKLQRIRKAARDVFLKRGYEAATMREISAKADVAFGTLFLYATNKQDLLLLLFDEEVPRIAEKALESAEAKAQIIDQIVAFFTEFYRFHNITPNLSRDMIREITFSSGGMVAARLWASVRDMERHLATLIAKAQAGGKISAAVSPALAAHIVYSLYRIELRFCLDQPEPDIAGSLGNFREQLGVIFAGLKARPPAPVKRGRGPGKSRPVKRRERISKQPS